MRKTLIILSISLLIALPVLAAHLPPEICPPEICYTGGGANTITEKSVILTFLMMTLENMAWVVLPTYSPFELPFPIPSMVCPFPSKMTLS
jgi:hypothetical protein